MRINWGTGIVIAIVAFMSFIMFMVITMVTNKKYEHDLVTEKYYQKELVYQQDLEARRNAKNLTEKIKVEKITSGLRVEFPSNFNPKEIRGEVFLYRPSNKDLDFEMPISISKNHLLVSEKHLLSGRWNISVAFTHNNIEYLHQQELMY